MNLLLNLFLNGDIKKEFNINITLNEDDAYNKRLMDYIGNINKNTIDNDEEENEFHNFIMKQLESRFEDYCRYVCKIVEIQLDNSKKDQQKLIVNIEAKKRQPVFKCLVLIDGQKLDYDIGISDEIINDVIQKTKSGSCNVTSNNTDDSCKNIYNTIKSSVVEKFPNYDNEKYSISTMQFGKLSSDEKTNKLIVAVTVKIKKVNGKDKTKKSEIKQKGKEQQETKEDKKIKLSLNFNLTGEINDKLNIKLTTTTKDPIMDFLNKAVNNPTKDAQKQKFDQFIKKHFEHNSSYAENYEYNIKDKYRIKYYDIPKAYTITIKVEIKNKRDKRELLLNLHLKGCIERKVTISATTTDSNIINYIKDTMSGKNSINSNHNKDKFNNFIEEHLSYYVPVNYKCELNNKIKIEKLDESKISVTMDINVKKRKIVDFELKFQNLKENLEKLKSLLKLKSNITDDPLETLKCDENTLSQKTDQDIKDLVIKLQESISADTAMDPFENNFSSIVDNVKKIKDNQDNKKSRQLLEQLTKSMVDPLDNAINNMVKNSLANDELYKEIFIKISKYPRLQDLIKELTEPKLTDKDFNAKFEDLIKTFSPETQEQIVECHKKAGKIDNSIKQKLDKEIHSKMDEIEPVLMNFRAELFKNQNRMDSMIKSIIEPIANMDDKSTNFDAFKQTMNYALKSAFLPNKRIYDNIIRNSSKSKTEYEKFNIFKLSEVSSNQFYRASYNETHKFDTRGKDNKFYRFGVSIIKFKNAIVQGVYKTDNSNKQVTDGIWIYNKDWISDFKHDVEYKNIRFTKAGFINIEKSSKDYKSSDQNILGKKPDAYKIEGILNNEVNINKLLNLITGTKKAKITQTYEANTPKRLHEILTNVNPPFKAADETEFLFIVLTEAECGPDRGGRAALKALREICREIRNELKDNKDVQEIKKKLETARNSNEYATCNIFREVINKLFLFTKYGNGGMQSGINNIEDGTKTFEEDVEEQINQKNQTNNNPKKKTKKEDKEKDEDEDKDNKKIEESAKGQLWRQIGRIIYKKISEKRKKTNKKTDKGLNYSSSEE